MTITDQLFWFLCFLMPTLAIVLGAILIAYTISKHSLAQTKAIQELSNALVQEAQAMNSGETGVGKKIIDLVEYVNRILYKKSGIRPE